MAKFTCTFKDPDHATEGWTGAKGELQKIEALKAQYVEWDEYITVEFDTETKTARVLTAKETRGEV